MRMPIKLNRSHWAQAMAGLLPSADDPRVLFAEDTGQVTFTTAISTFKFKTTQKTTQKDRFPLTIDVLRRLGLVKPSVLDVGASDGTTSFDVMRALSPEKYFVTDLNIRVSHQTIDEKTYFYDDSDVCILIVSDKFIAYPDQKNGIFPSNFLLNSFFKPIAKRSDISANIELINPILRKAGQNVQVQKYDIFSPWTSEKVDVVIAANILNKVYFSDKQLLLAARNLIQALKSTGRLVVIDNRESEMSTIFKLDAGELSVECEIGGGTEIRELLISNQDYLSGQAG